ncbi:DUF5020 family protein [Parabacteroides sp. PF5-9]|uniref:nucleoside-specific channel-forming Tsx family protein n=1 Tax=Parabacteroides sp. PF5-9 TaxID=1742404 RepID=UPI0024737F9F|nr:DUF5020 family protein [Parabacteroides sp. PF5-9]MDH6356935.1 hypothetical protein [Parabacteroides sp. PF5-9]
MKRSVLLLFFIFVAMAAKTQNIQLHYDLGSHLYDKDLKGRPQLTSTVEMFKTDKWGSTFFFVDMDYTGDGITSAYWEISRELQFWESPFSVHVEYNGGLAKGFSFSNAYLGGVTYSYLSPDFSRNITFTPSYKYIHGLSSPHNFQLTATWFIHFGANKVCTFSGFADWWREKNPHGDFIFLAEPQFWVNLNKFKCIDDKFNLSIGSEVELSHHFGGLKGFYAIPTLAIKWAFD